MIDDLIIVAHRLVESVEHDVNGLNGKGGHGGLTSDRTLRTAHEMRIILDRIERRAPADSPSSLSIPSTAGEVQ